MKTILCTIGSKKPHELICLEGNSRIEVAAMNQRPQHKHHADRKKNEPYINIAYSGSSR
jgi:hypothetical protein